MLKKKFVPRIIPMTQEKIVPKIIQQEANPMTQEEIIQVPKIIQQEMNVEVPIPMTLGEKLNQRLQELEARLRGCSTPPPSSMSCSPRCRTR